jgi:hypothetical protein
MYNQEKREGKKRMVNAPVGVRKFSKYQLSTALSCLPCGGDIDPIRFVLLGMGHPLRLRLIVFNIYPGLGIRHRHAVVVLLDRVRLEALHETLYIALFRPRLCAHQATHRQRGRGGRFGTVTTVRARDDLGLPPEANLARRLIA